MIGRTMIGRWIGGAVVISLFALAPHDAMASDGPGLGRVHGLDRAVQDYQHGLVLAVRFKRAGDPVRAALTAAQAAEDLAAASLVAAESLPTATAVRRLHRAAVAARALAAAEAGVEAAGQAGTPANMSLLTQRREAAFQAFRLVSPQRPAPMEAAISGGPTTGVLYALVATRPIPGHDTRMLRGVRF